MGLVFALGFTAIYVPVIASEERFLRATFPAFDDYCQRVPRLIPRLRPAQDFATEDSAEGAADRSSPIKQPSGAFSLSLYLQHREYNAGIGAVLLYLSLLLLRPLLAAFVNLPQ
jgi:hypothetical protein